MARSNASTLCLLQTTHADGPARGYTAQQSPNSPVRPTSAGSCVSANAAAGGTGTKPCAGCNFRRCAYAGQTATSSGLPQHRPTPADEATKRVREVLFFRVVLLHMQSMRTTEHTRSGARTRSWCSDMERGRRHTTARTSELLAHGLASLTDARHVVVVLETPVCELGHRTPTGIGISGTARKNDDTRALGQSTHTREKRRADRQTEGIQTHRDSSTQTLPLRYHSPNVAAPVPERRVRGVRRLSVGARVFAHGT